LIATHLTFRPLVAPKSRYKVNAASKEATAPTISLSHWEIAPLGLVVVDAETPPAQRPFLGGTNWSRLAYSRKPTRGRVGTRVSNSNPSRAVHMPGQGPYRMIIRHTIMGLASGATY